jgi:hypothetical protein
VVAAATQIGDSTILAILTVVIAPLAGVAWREREKRLTAENECRRLKDKIEEGKDETDGLHADASRLRDEVRRIVAEEAWRSGGGEGLFPYHSRRSTNRRRKPSRSPSTGPSRGSGRGSGGGSGSGTGRPT